MDITVFLAVLVAALLHASWNSLIKTGADRFAGAVLLVLAQGVLSLLCLPFVPVPPSGAWGWLAASVGLHTGYILFLVKAYDHADLSQAYPLARGTAPLLVTVVSVALLGTTLSPSELLAIGAISSGILLMAWSRDGEAGRMSGRALFYALGTACFTASYTLSDGLGARAAGTASGYITWMMTLDGVVMAGIAASLRGPRVLPAGRGAWAAGLAGGALSLGSYWIAVWAFTRAPIALVASLRETSILFAVLIAATVMRERVDPWRWTAVGCIGAGVVLMRL